jgi:hypothetical protein
MSPVRYELGFYIPEDDILHNHRREELKSYNLIFCLTFLFLLSDLSQRFQRIVLVKMLL